MAVPVDIYVKDDSALPAAIDGVVVLVLDPNTFALVAQGTTDVLGHASLVLPGSASPGTTYELRFYKMGVFFANPVLIQVLEPVVAPASNIFDASGTLVGTLPVATDPRVCRCTGRFVNYSNQPLAGMTVRIFADQTQPGVEVPLIVDGNLVGSAGMAFQTDADGYLSVDLHRGGEYRIMYPGEEEKVWCFNVPDRSSVNLIDLIHPYPVSLAWDPTVAPANAVSVAVGQSIDVPFSALFSNYITISQGLIEWLTFTNGDNTLMDVVVSATGVATITGRSPGTAQVTGANLPSLLPSRVPYYNTLVPPLNVTVTP